MAIEQNDLIQITMLGTYKSQQWANVFFYQIDTTDELSTLDAFLAQFTLGYIASVMALMHGGAALTFTEARNLTDGISIAVGSPVGVVGALGGESLPSFMAWGFRFNRATALTRHGHKRIVGLSESSLTEGVAAAAMITPLNDAATFMAGVIDDDHTEGHPVIVGRVPQGEEGAGRLDISRVNDVASVVYTGVTTQNSRKVGRGS